MKNLKLQSRIEADIYAITFHSYLSLTSLIAAAYFYLKITDKGKLIKGYNYVDIFLLSTRGRTIRKLHTLLNTGKIKCFIFCKNTEIIK